MGRVKVTYADGTVVWKRPGEFRKSQRRSRVAGIPSDTSLVERSGLGRCLTSAQLAGGWSGAELLLIAEAASRRRGASRDGRFEGGGRRRTAP